LLEELVSLVTQENPELDPRKGHVVITVPASFSALSRQDTLKAAEDAGFSRGQVALLDEPVAALIDTVNHQDAGFFLSDRFKNVLMFDYGGGTCDLALMRVRLRSNTSFGLHIETLAISPYRKLGGDEVDRAVMNEIVWPALCSSEERSSLSTATVEALGDTLTVAVARKLKEKICDDVARLRKRGSWPDVDALSKVPPADVELAVPLSVPGLKLPRHYTMTVEQFENTVMRPFIEVPLDVDDEDDAPQSLARPVLETLKRAGMSIRELDRLILNGVSSLNPFVEKMLEEQLADPGRSFDEARVWAVPSLTTSVARGAALACYWQHARREQLVAPIISEPLGVIVQSGAPVEMVAAGTELPFPGPDALHEIRGRLFVPHGCGEEMLVPYYAGHVGSPRAPRHAGTVKVKLPEETPAASDVTVSLRIDGDKTLSWWFAIAGGPPQRAESIPDAWTQRVPTIPERALAEHRRTLRRLVDSGQQPTRAMLVQEAALMRRAGDPQGALVALNDLIETFGLDGYALNIRGLCYNDLGHFAKEMEDYKTGADLDPKSAFLRGNYGCCLEEAGRIDEAEAEIRRALAIDSGLAYLHCRLGKIARDTGREAEALEEYQEAERLFDLAAKGKPGDPEAWVYLAVTRLALSDDEGARKAFERAEDVERFASLGGSASDVVSGTQNHLDERAPAPTGANGRDHDSSEAVTRRHLSAGGTGLDKVAGMHSLKELLRREVVEPLRNPEPFKRYRLTIPNGILLSGPPGCGKTYIARQLAEELGYHFVEVIPSALASPYIHSTVKLIGELFDKAAAQAPAIIFIDEFEALVPSRSELGGLQEYKAEEVNEFLAQLNGCSEKGILVMAATNQPEKIDPAVRRTGRLDKHIYVGPPDPEAREEMLALHLDGRPVSDQLDIRSLAEELGGYSASDIKFLVDEAARCAMRTGQSITRHSFRTAMRGVRPSVSAEVEAKYRSLEERGDGLRGDEEA
jgi:AAA+ superfamily predicted ATPase/Flp pilus assembly protein TadD